MSDAIMLAFAGVSCFLAAAAALISLLLLNKVATVARETAAIKKAIDFAAVETRRQELLESLKAWENSILALKNDARKLGIDLSRIFAGVASILNETHKLEGNPHPRLDAGQLHEINQRLLGMGESCLGATRIAEGLTDCSRRLSESLECLKTQIDPGSR